MPSMGSTGDVYDNAMVESFFATLEREVIDRRRFRSRYMKRAWQSSPGWKAGTNHTGATRPSATCHPSITRGGCYQEMLKSQALNRPQKQGETRNSLVLNTMYGTLTSR